MIGHIVRVSKMDAVFEVEILKEFKHFYRAKVVHMIKWNKNTDISVGSIIKVSRKALECYIQTHEPAKE